MKKKNTPESETMSKEDKKEISRLQAIQDKTKANWKSCKKCLWNSDKKEFFGRTASSWAKILGFYLLLFYPLLFLFWYSMMLVLMKTLTKERPKYILEESIIGKVPALAYRPVPNNSLKSDVIEINTNSTESVAHWVSGLNSFLEPYHNNQTHANNCSVNQPTSIRRVCKVPLDKDGVSVCKSSNSFGYKDGKPCVLLKLNRIYNWYPKTFDTVPDQLQSLLQGDFQKELVYFTCEGKTDEDKGNVGDIQYFPGQGVPSYYYPFTNQKGYLSPFVFAQFKSLTRGVVVQVKCRAWFRDISSAVYVKKTSVIVKLKVD